MSQSILVIGAGFAGLWSALAAKRTLQNLNKADSVQITLVAPEPTLVVRPRLYEANPQEMGVPITDLLRDAGIKYIQGLVEKIKVDSQSVTVRSPSAPGFDLSYSRLILAAGGALSRPSTVPGLSEHAFDVDTIDAASKLDAHIKQLPTTERSAERDTIVVCGAGFTGLEIATELPSRLAAAGHKARIVLVESSTALAPTLGDNPRPAITEVLSRLNIDVKIGSPVSAVDSTSVTLASGERIPTMTAIWTVGQRATPLTEQIAAQKDKTGRIVVAQDLRVPDHPHVFAAGDAAYASADESHAALMSCQHAMPMGRLAGHNAASDLVGNMTVPYTQPAYNTCLDLGSEGALVTSGWDRKIYLEGSQAKAVKGYINTKLIYPPANAAEAVEAASIEQPSSDELLKTMMKSVTAH